ncbi:MAG: hypothetical protein COA62_07715 [Rhodobiaceae bacterium]|nr:MAG: hypothetical protein COA62_07715 [Rhodobiaceae bacterium]
MLIITPAYRHPNPLLRAGIAALLLCAIGLPAQAEPYQQCVSLVESDPDAAYDVALDWEATDLTGGALHCGGLALTALGLFDAAAKRFHRAATEGQKLGSSERVALLRQSGEAWLLAGQGTEAVAVFTEALAFTPTDPSLFFARARAHDFGGETILAYADVNAALDIDTTHGELYLLRARLNRQLDQLDDAMRDIEAALASNINPISVRLERGLIRYEHGDDAGALEDWRFVEQAGTSPDGTVGAASRAATRFIVALEAPAQEQAAPTLP